MTSIRTWLILSSLLLSVYILWSYGKDEVNQLILGAFLAVNTVLLVIYMKTRNTD